MGTLNSNAAILTYLRDAKKFAKRHIDTLHRARERGDLFAFQDVETGWWSTTREGLAAYLAGVPYSMVIDEAA